MINRLEIKNFKSIKNIKFSPKKLNIFIGAPNVGKSNILEALSLFSVPYVNNPKNKFEGLIRFENLNNLFYDNQTANNIEILTDTISSYLLHLSEDNSFNFFISSKPFKNFNEIISEIEKNNIEIFFNNLYNKKGEIIYNKTENKYENYYSSIRKYTFNKNTKGERKFNEYLLPPHGNNFNTILQNSNKVFEESASFFEIYGLELLYDVETNLFEIQKKQGKRVYKYPIKLMADTLQRIIFYLTVIETNKNTSIILEEPETHSYPPYVKMLAERITRNDTNQFFITTHSPYLLYNIIENTKFEDRNIIITYYENYQTKIKILSKKQINKILEDDIEIFFNTDKLLSDE